MGIKPAAFVTLSPVGIIGTADHFHYGQYFELTGNRGNVWLFKIDEVMEMALKHKNKKYLEHAKEVNKFLCSDAGLCIGAPLAYLINNLTLEFGDNAVVNLNCSGGNPDDRVKS